MIPAKDFARTAREVFELQTVPYRKGGDTLKGMDSGGLIEYCLRENGINAKFKGTNDIYRNAGPTPIPLKEAMKQQLIKPGTLLLHVASNGNEPAEYKDDKLGNCDYAMIAISSTEGVYPSEKTGTIIKRKIELVNGKPNMVMFCKYIDYGSGSPTFTTQQSSNNAPLSSFSKRARTTSDLRLREAPSNSGSPITTMPKGALVDILGEQADWIKVRYHGATYTHIGWCFGEFLDSID